MEKKITINVNSTYKFLQVWNGIFNLTSMELKVLSSLVDCAAGLGDINICSPDSKKAAAKVLGIKDYNTLNNYVKRFKDKGVLNKNNNIYSLNPFLDPDTSFVEVIINKN